jgi:hypothetical protein
VSQTLENAVLLTLDGYGHTSDSDPRSCIYEAVAKYLVTTTTPPVDTICHANHAPFDPGFNDPLLPEQPID